MNMRRDWLMSQIEEVVQLILRFVFGKEDVAYIPGETENQAEADMLYAELETLLAKQKICEAENLLYEKFNSESDTHLLLALNFYDKLNRLSDEELENADFSREEIQDGVKYIAGQYGITLPVI